jgi:actin-related protein 9
MNGQQPNGREKSTTTYIRPGRSHPPMPEAKASDYLIGSQLEDAITAGEDLEIYWPFEHGEDIHNWPQAEALW